MGGALLFALRESLPATRQVALCSREHERRRCRSCSRTAAIHSAEQRPCTPLYRAADRRTSSAPTLSCLPRRPGPRRLRGAPRSWRAAVYSIQRFLQRGAGRLQVSRSFGGCLSASTQTSRPTRTTPPRCPPGGCCISNWVGLLCLRRVRVFRPPDRYVDMERCTFAMWSWVTHVTCWVYEDDPTDRVRVHEAT